MKGKKEKRRKIGKPLLILIASAAYLIVCTAVTGLDYLEYLKTRTQTDLDTDLVYQVYSEEEISADPRLEDVRLYHFPAEGGEDAGCVIYLPGGSYRTCNPYDVCIPAAAEAAGMGYDAFVLTYRVGEHDEDFMPVKNVAAGIGWLFGHADELGIDMDNYMLTGFSAGGHLAGIFGSAELGYAKYGVPKPGAIGLAYPLICASEGFFENWNVVSDYVNSNLRRHTVSFLLGDDADRGAAESIDVQNCVTPDYPRVFMVQGDKDFLVRYRGNSDLMAEALERNGVDFEYRLYEGLTHGFGTGTGTEAEGWNRDALLFWSEGVQKDPSGN